MSDFRRFCVWTVVAYAVHTLILWIETGSPFPTPRVALDLYAMSAFVGVVVVAFTKGRQA